MVEVAEAYLAQGFAAMKVRFHRGDWRDDIKALEAVRARVGQRLALMVDCNQGWRLPWDVADSLDLQGRAGRRPRAGAPGRLLDGGAAAPGRPGRHAALARSDLVRIAGGEMTRELTEFRELITGGCLDVLQPDAALVGGITGLRRVAFMAAEHNLIFTPHTWTNGMGVVANAHLTAALTDAPWLEYPYDPPEWGLDRRDYMMAEPLRVDGEGWIVLSEAPGMGYALDEEMLARTRVG